MFKKCYNFLVMDEIFKRTVLRYNKISRETDELFEVY